MVVHPAALSLLKMAALRGKVCCAGCCGYMAAGHLLPAHILLHLQQIVRLRLVFSNYIHRAAAAGPGTQTGSKLPQSSVAQKKSTKKENTQNPFLLSSAQQLGSSLNGCSCHDTSEEDVPVGPEGGRRAHTCGILGDDGCRSHAEEDRTSSATTRKQTTG